jgi:hypothetical protein
MPLATYCLSAMASEEQDFQKTMEQAKKKAFDRFVEKIAPSWMKKEAEFPFECTECGYDPLVIVRSFCLPNSCLASI